MALRSGGVRRPRARAQAGFALLDVVIAAAILAVALLGHASTVLSGHRLSRTVEHRTVALEALRQFVERLRSDPDWGGLYAGLVSLSSTPTPPGELPGRAPTDYYPDYVVPQGLGTVRVRVEVPQSGVDLREDAVDDRFGLPYDLNGDGEIDAAPHQDDCTVLPVSIRFSWHPAGEPPSSVEVLTWLSGAR
jgi:type II secretory pathway pseudopilin PulG